MRTLDAARAPNRHLLVHIEGVNFDATVWDVNDLATQRGASLALLNAPRALVYAAFGKAHVVEIFTGASIGRYLVPKVDTVAGVESRLRALIVSPAPCGELANILPHLSFVVAAVDPDEYSGNMAIARRAIIAKARRAQLQTPTVIAPAPVSHTKLCKLNPMLPAASDGQDYSASIDARRQYGRQQKQAFYGQLGVTLDDGDVFAREMDDLVRDSPKHVRETICNKVAHVYLDGNDFTAIRECAIGNACDPLKQERKFSTFVANRRTRLLQCLIGALSKSEDMFTDGRDAERVFRWETLLWGGDEAAFIAPAWILARLLDLLAEELRVGWNFNGTALTHKCGIYITDRKTPIVLARRLAGALGDSAKQRGVNTVQIMVSESVDPPVDVTRIDPGAAQIPRERLRRRWSREFHPRLGASQEVHPRISRGAGCARRAAAFPTVEHSARRRREPALGFRTQRRDLRGDLRAEDLRRWRSSSTAVSADCGTAGLFPAARRMTTGYELELCVKVRGPALSQATGVPQFGIDCSQARVRDKFVLPGTHVKGHLRHVFEQARAAGVPNIDGEWIARWLGAPSGRADESDANAFAFQRKDGLLSVGDLSTNVSNGGTVTRIAIDKERGSVRQGMMQIVEAPWSCGETAVFAGRIRLRGSTTAGERADLRQSLIWALQLIPAVGAFKSAGFGRVEEATLGETWRELRASTGTVDTDAIASAGGADVWLEPAEPFLVWSYSYSGNFFAGDTTIPGQVLKGVAARWLADRGLLKGNEDTFARLIFRHAYPVPAAAPDARPALDFSPRPIAMPLSIYRVDDGCLGSAGYRTRLSMLLRAQTSFIWWVCRPGDSQLRARLEVDTQSPLAAGEFVAKACARRTGFSARAQPDRDSRTGGRRP